MQVTDPFVKLVQAARQAGQFRDAVIRDVHKRYAPIPRDVSVRIYASNDDRTWGTYKRPAVHVTTASMIVKPRKPRVSRMTRYGLTRDNLEVVRIVVDHRRREVIRATDELQAAVGRLRKETPEEKAAKLNGLTLKAWDAEPWRGMIPAREARYSERGASGIKGVRGMASRVSIGDVHKPVALLLPLLTVGVATHPGASDVNYCEAIAYVRRHPLAATVRVKRPASHGAYLSSIVPVREYTDLARERKGEARQARQARTVAVQGHRMMAGDMAPIGNVD